MSENTQTLENLAQRDFKSQRLLTWRLLIEEFLPTIKYIPGTTNITLDTLSHYPRKEEPTGLSQSEMTLGKSHKQWPGGETRYEVHLHAGVSTCHDW